MLHLSLLLLAGILSAADGPAPVARIIPAKSVEPAAVEITGISSAALGAIRGAKPTAAELAKACKLVVADGKLEAIAARQGAAGIWSVSEKAIRFEPQFPLVPGVKYRILLDFEKLPRFSANADTIDIALLIPKPPPGAPIAVAAMFPSANRLPENTLRFYIHFSGPMSRGDIYRRIKLVRDDGKEVNRPFLELDEELWSTDGLRVTVLFHPGRVKRELVPREEEGPILEEGHRYTMTIGRDWKDAEGRPLVAEFRKTFSVGPPDEAPIDLSTWTLIPPRAGSDSPLIVRLAKPVDRALLATAISILDSSGNKVAGEISVGGGERVAAFAPAKPWKKGEYRLLVADYLEDVCGNRVGEPFEVDATKPLPKQKEPKPSERRFIVR